MNIENSILFLGDVAPYRPYSFTNKINTVINLECPITTKGKPATGKIILGARENYLPEIFGSRLLCASLCNNHILDHGVEGLLSTISELEKSGIRYFGLNSIESNNPLMLNFNDQKIAFIAAVCLTTDPVLDSDGANYLSPLDSDMVIQKISSVRNIADRIVVYLHFGAEESSLPSGKDIQVARDLIDGGADIVIGSHAHCPQPIEKYRNGVIAYNLGNFLMPEMKGIPSYFDDNGKPGIFFNSRTMPWNRVSWGLMIDMASLETRIKKFMFTKNRIIELPFTPYDRFLRLPGGISVDYDKKVESHQKARRYQRRLIDFINKPHVPQILKLKL
jgi:poly-gamma-glutamate synthesis protein (capsule biosynthesis protein)